MATQPDQVNTGALATMFALTALATVAAALGITALVRSEQGELGKVRDEPITRAYRSLRADQERSLNAPPAWVDREKGLVSLPIDRAIALTVQDIRRGRTVVGAAKAEEAEEKPAEEGATPEDGAKAPEEGAQEAPATGEEGAPGAAPTDSDSKDAAPKGEQPGKAEPQKTEPEKAQPQKSEPSSPAPSQPEPKAPSGAGEESGR